MIGARGVAVERTGNGLLYAMKLIGIEHTQPGMKLVLDETLAPGVKATYRAADEVSAPLMRGLLSIAGVASIFHSSDFMAVNAEILVAVPRTEEVSAHKSCWCRCRYFATSRCR